MIDVILHIGRHKTGTSSLQIFLDQNPDLLIKNGFIYPRMFYKACGHHTLAENLARNITNKLSEKEVKDKTHHYRRKIVRRFLSSNATLIFSSEAFQNCDPKVIRQLFNPERFNVRVVCYFRDQVSYYCSAYNQRVHANFFNEDINDFYRKSFNGNYLEFMDKWSEYFEVSECRVFDKEQLHNGDIIADFCQSILGFEYLKSNMEMNNPSLTRRLLAFKLKLNAEVQAGSLEIPLPLKHLYRKLGQLSNQDTSGRFYLTDDLTNKIINDYSDSNKTFSKKYLKNTTLKFPIIKNKNSEPYIMPNSEYLMLLKKIAN